ncbi:adenine phosphoribosyltransferase [Sphaerisporangium fuscum]|uniref:adenine phosphoribosyltransferase n=1 Tax=Sphaerisporangium fuscum TaxID=2835868 RepID=UPI001BDBBEDD|nr:adenine phosphoribosyltransferase [Sphaerisporangium fuscum]
MTDITTTILDRIRDVPDYPQPGVMFKDITPLLGDPVAFAAVVDALAADLAVDKVVGIEARGFILAAPVACRAGAGFVPVRKKGKLPAETLEASYDLEYGSAVIEVHRDAFAPGDRVLIVDDVLATGGTARAAVELVGRAGATVVGVSVLMELAFLSGRDRLSDIDVRALVVV